MAKQRKLKNTPNTIIKNGDNAKSNSKQSVAHQRPGYQRKIDKCRNTGPQGSHFFTRFFSVLLIATSLYLAPLFALFTIPSFQAKIIFMNAVSWPPFLNLSDPASVGLIGTRHFFIKSRDNIQLGVWHIPPKSLRNKINSLEDYDKALNERPVFLYSHGNAGTRGGNHRVELYQVLSEMDVNVITFDYRGFGDSTNVHPTASGLVSDSKEIYHWLRKKTVKSNNHIFVWGHSMGTAVTSRFVSELSQEGYVPTGVVLESGFNNVKAAITNYPLANVYNFLPFFECIIDSVIEAQKLNFVSEKNIQFIKSPLLMLHAEDDKTVKIELGRALRDAAEMSRSPHSVFKYIEFDKSYRYGHKFICRHPSLPNIIRDFMDTASKAIL